MIFSMTQQTKVLRLPAALPPHFSYVCASCGERHSTAARPAYSRPYPESWSYDCSECAQTQGLLLGGQGVWL